MCDMPLQEKRHRIYLNSVLKWVKIVVRDVRIRNYTQYL